MSTQLDLLLYGFGIFFWTILFSIGVEHLYKYIQTKQNEAAAEASREDEPQDEPTALSKIVFTRNFNTNVSTTNEVTDALLDYISNINTVSQLKYTSFYVMDTQEEFLVEESKGITGKVLNVVTDDSTGTIKLLTFQLESTRLSITELREWINDIHSEYTVNKNNELGSRRYFFNQLPDNKVRGEKLLHLNFDMSPFDTTKTLNNLYGTHISQVQTRIELFNDKTWYQRNGVPHTLGILLYGEPGCGKTSLIKAVANDTNRHVFNIRLNDNMTKEQLNSLFFDPKVHVRNKESNVSTMITIPLNQRLYVLEDIDCAENTVLNREQLEARKNTGRNANKPKLPEYAEGMFGDRELEMLQEQVNKEKEERIDLAFLLNILDGVLETPQRLTIMTTNFVQKLDPALLRPGRIDMILEFRKCSIEMLLAMVQNFFRTNVDTSKLLDENLNELLTPAEVQEVLCNWFHDGNGAVQQICNLAYNKLRQLRHEKATAAPQMLYECERGREEKKVECHVPGASSLCPFSVEGASSPYSVETPDDGALKVMPRADATPVSRHEPSWLQYHL